MSELKLNEQFESLKNFAKIGSKLEVKLKDSSGIIVASGNLCGIFESSFVLDNDESIVSHDANKLLSWTILKKSLTIENHNNFKKDNSVTIESKIESKPETLLEVKQEPKSELKTEKNDKKKSQLTNLNEGTGKPIIKSVGNSNEEINKFLKDSATQLERFIENAKIEIPMPSISFMTAGYEKNIQNQIIQLRDKYIFSFNVKEPQRLVPHLTTMLKLANQINDSELFYLVGRLIIYAKADEFNAIEAFEHSLWLDPNKLLPKQALASYYLNNKNYEKAMQFVFWILLVNKIDDHTVYLQVLCAISRKVNFDKWAPIGELLFNIEPQCVSKLKLILLELDIIKSNNELVDLVQNNKFDYLRQDKTLNQLFIWSSSGVYKPIRKFNSISTVAPIASCEKLSFGQIISFDPKLKQGYINDKKALIEYKFDENLIEDSEILSDLHNQKFGQFANFTGKLNDEKNSHPFVCKFENFTKMNPNKKAPLKQRLSSLPKDNSYFAKAMRSEQLGELENAEKFYIAEIENKGSLKRKSSIKNLASLYDRKIEQKKAIDLINKYFNIFDEHEHSALYQIKINLLFKLKDYQATRQLIEKVL